MRVSCKGQGTIVEDHIEFLVGVLVCEASLIGAHLTPTIVAQTKGNYTIITRGLFM